MKRLTWVLFTLILFTLIEPLDTNASANPPPKISQEKLAPIAESVERAIRGRQIPGAVILIGNQGKVIYRRAFGHRALEPKKVRMTLDTLFDVASLTKVVATTTALLQLVENGKVSLDDPVAKYWPEFKENGKAEITLQHLLTHYSGLRPDLDLNPSWSGCETALKKIEEEKPTSPPGTRFVYSDINFEILGELVQRVSGESLEAYCDRHIFKPLGMNDTCFKPSSVLFDRIAPSRKDGIKEVHDPTAYRMGGIAGHAGLFSTAEDLSIYAQMLLDGGRGKNGQILSQAMIDKMTLPQSPPDKTPFRGLGWDIGPPFASNRNALLPAGSYGHKGFTGTMIWVDPVSRTYVILLSNRLHPNGKGNVEALRGEIISLVSDSMGPVSMEQILAMRPSLAGESKDEKDQAGNLRAGIDVLVSEKFAPLAGLRVGLITNHSGLDSAGRRTIDLLSKAPRLKLAAIFSPEHGLSGKEEGKISPTIDPSAGLPVYSLYGDSKRPTEKMLRSLDALVFDIQDAGARFFTYITTMAYAMEAAARKGIAFYVLDRPNPITGFRVQGPIMDEGLKSFTGYYALPVRHGMTVGELAGMFNVENRIGAKLHVIKMEGYRPSDWYDETGLLWVGPSPNLRTVTQAILYPGVAMVEGANVSVGRGTDSPFELLGAPWINARELAGYLDSRKIQGIRFMPVDFIPRSSCFKNRLCHGVQIVLVDRQALDSPALGVEIASALYRLYPRDFQLQKTLGLIGSHEVLQAIKDGQDPSTIVEKWQRPLEQFCKLRAKYLIY
ncbi:MAG TPA: exo-beta-N-acetylmuramidase NamZ domain-containing protein [Thermodesulfobacteriota bacterium]|nr:exo-beta-N-acetylmuramidase NamZ domain-containing protein [Thermodesulfobacteriota bacterium]